MDELWREALEEIRKRVGKQNFEAWIKPLHFESHTKNEIRLDVPNKFFREFVGLNNDQIREIREGKAVAKILDSPTADQVFVFGSVYIDSTPERYLKFASDGACCRIEIPSEHVSSDHGAH